MSDLTKHLFLLPLAALFTSIPSQSAVSTPFGQRPSDWVEGTQTLDDGSTRDFYNRAASLRWESPGDWRDANDVAHGPLAAGIFADDFERGDLAAWTTPAN